MNNSKDSTFAAVKSIIAEVAEKGDVALAVCEKRFSGNNRESFRVSQEEIAKACTEVAPELMAAMELAATNIRRFAELQFSTISELPVCEVSPGVWLGHRIIPVDSCCCYVPGGRYPLFSTALMLAIPARVAGVKRICACSPVAKGTSLPQAATLAALCIAGVDEVYAIGGAQAIAAVAHGTESIAPVSLIVGPGNRYVTEAKRQVYGKVGIDFVAGPSEVLVIADDTAEPRIIAADLLAQSEHDLDARGILITTSKDVANQVAAEVQNLLPTLDTEATARAAWEANGRIIIVETLNEAVRIANEIAPEHLEVNTRNPDELMPLLRNYGSLFLGTCSAEVFGDYVAGTNHTLPTMGAGKYTGGVWAGTFVKTCTLQKITPEGAALLAPAADIMARYEGLSAHALAARQRLEIE